MMETNDLYLGFIHYIGEDSDGLNQYEFIFTDNPNEFWGEDFNESPACLCNNLIPDDNYITTRRLIKTSIKLDLIQNNCCFSVSDALDGIVSIAWLSLDGLDEYPSQGRIFFMFGEEYNTVEKKLALYNILFEV